MTKRLGLFGGTFDPVHLGHLHAAQTLLSEFNLDTIYFIPAYQPVHRDSPQASIEQRLTMLQLTLAETDELILDTREIDRGGALYAKYTIDEYRQQFPEAELFFILGTDAFNAIDTWFEWRMLFDDINFIILPRPGYNLNYSKDVAELISQKHQSMGANSEVIIGQVLHSQKAMLRLSATEVRTAIQNNEEISDLLSENAANFVKEHNIYGKDLLK